MFENFVYFVLQKKKGKLFAVVELSKKDAYIYTASDKIR